MRWVGVSAQAVFLVGSLQGGVLLASPMGWPVDKLFILHDAHRTDWAAWQVEGRCPRAAQKPF